MDADQVAFIAIPILVGLALLFTLVSLFRRGGEARTRSVRVRPVEHAATPPPPTAPAPEAEGAVVLAGATPTTEIVHYQEGVPAEIEEPVYRIVVEELSEDEKGVTRRMFFNRAITGFMTVGLGSFGLAMLMFLWPAAAGGFGSKIKTTRSIADIKAALEGSRIEAPVYFPDARAYVLPWAESDEAQFEGRGVISAGLIAVYQRCVHLGCRVPWCASSQGFECPCHGSKYNAHGEYVGGPAPRNLDRFAITETPDGFLEIDTGSIVETPRAPRTTADYPRGPNCL